MTTKLTSELIWQDVQHQELFRIINDIKTDKSSAILYRLTDYIQHHFHVEEEYMRQLDYPHMKEHVKAHHDFENWINEYFNKSYVTNDDYREGLSDYLAGWLRDHIYGIDKDLEQFVMNSGKK